MARSLTRNQEEELVREYVADTDTPIKELADRFGVSRQTVHNIVRRHGVVPARRGDMPVGEVDRLMPPVFVEAMAKRALITLLEELHETKHRVERLEALCRKHGLDPDRV